MSKTEQPAKKSRRYINLYVAIQDHWIWNKKPLCHGAAWLDLVMRANWQPKDWYCKKTNSIIKVGRGELISTTRDLALHWGWSQNKVLRFLKLLKSESMVKSTTESSLTHLTICNYEVYQGSLENVKSTTESTSESMTVQRRVNLGVNDESKTNADLNSSNRSNISKRGNSGINGFQNRTPFQKKTAQEVYTEKGMEAWEYFNQLEEQEKND